MACEGLPRTSLFEKGSAACDLATGFGDEVKGFAKATSGAPDTLIGSALDVLPENQINRELLEKPTKRGNAFVFKKDRTSVELHHVGQSADDPYIEMHISDHRGKGNYKKNHPNSNAATQVDRNEFNKQKRHYWQKEYDKY